MRKDQFILASEDSEVFEFPAGQYEVEQKPHLGLAVTVYINKSKQTPQHTVACIAHVNFDKLMLGHSLELMTALTDVHKTPARILMQANISPMQMEWNLHNTAMLDELSANFNAMQRVEERLYAFASERASALKDYLDPGTTRTRCARSWRCT
jgi:hypothetical protein